MRDQAYGLRQLHKTSQPRAAAPRPTRRVIAVTSGKGGVGKTNFVANVSVSLSTQGASVLVLDADLSLGNLDVILGIDPEKTVADVLLGNARLEDVVYQGVAGVQVIPAAMGLQELTRLDHEDRQRLCDELLNLAAEDSVVLIDTGAGVSDNVIDLVLSSTETVLLTSREPTAIIDAYAMAKILQTRGYQGRIRLVVNMVKHQEEGRWVFERLQSVMQRHLSLKLEYLGCVLHDPKVSLSVCQQSPVIVEQPDSPASRCFTEIATRLLDLGPASRSVVELYPVA